MTKTQLTEQLQNVTITDVKKGNYSIHNEYNDVNDKLAGGSGKGDNDLSLDNIVLGELNPDLLKQRQDNELAATALKDKEIADKAIADAEVLRLANEGNETPEQKLARETLEANKIVLDTDGNEIDSEGNILKTKEVLAEEARLLKEENNVPLIEELINTTGITILGEDGKPKVYTDSIESIIEYSNDVADYKLKQNQDNFFKNYPKVKKYFEAQVNGVSDGEFFESRLTDWKTTTLDETNLEQQFNVVVKDLESKGIDKDRAIKMANRIKDSGKDVLLEESTLSLKSLQDTQIAVEKDKVEKYKLYEQEEETKRNNHWAKVNEAITKGIIGEYMIPEVDRKSFNDYVSLAVDDNGNSAAMIARSKQTLEQKLLLDYYTFKGMNFNSLVKIAVNNAKVDGLRNRIAKINKTGAMEQGLGNQQTINLKDIRLENVIRE